MKKILFFILISISNTLLIAQDFNFGSTPVALFNCVDGTLYDSGGDLGNYTDTENITMIICPGSGGLAVFASMANMDIASGDILNIYDGPSVADPIFPDMPLDNGTIYDLGAQFQASTSNASGCLTFEFIANNDGNVGDFAFDLTCNPRCQTFFTGIGTSIPDTTLTPTDIYLDVCIGDTVFVTAENSYPNNNDEYFQSDASSTYEWYWDFNSNIPDTGISSSHYYDTPGGYVANLVSYDTLGCRSYLDHVFKIRVAPEPEFVSLEDSIFCFGVEDTLVGLPIGTLVNGQIVQGDTVYFIPPVNSGDSTFLPDGNGAVYTNTLQIVGFDNGSVIEDCGGVLQVCVNMEHSFLGDLDINLVSPNGTSVSLKSYPGGGGTFLGNPLDPGTTAGSGIEYCFSSSSTLGFLVDGATQPATNTAGSTIVPGTYEPEGSFADFIGDDINGPWTIEIQDNLTIDDGYIFDWSLSIAPCMYPDVDSFVMSYGLGNWSSDPTITGIVNDSNTITFLPATQGLSSYTYATIDQFGCEYSSTYEVFVDSFAIELTPDDTSFCAGTTGAPITLTAVEPGTVSNCDYSLEMFDSFSDTWTGNNVTLFIDNVNQGTFSIDATDPDPAYSLETFSVSDGQEIQIQFSGGGSFIADISYNVLDSEGNIIYQVSNPAVADNFTTIASCSAPVTYSWGPSISETTPSIEVNSPASSTSYYVEATNENGCVSTDTTSVDVVIVPITISDDITICEGESTQLNATGGTTYTWSPGATLNSTTAASVTATPSTTTTYNVIYSLLGCDASASVTVSVESAPLLDINNGILPVEFCEGDIKEIYVDELTGWTYAWEDASGNPIGITPSISVTEQGTYTVEYTNGSCVNENSIFVGQNSKPVIDFSSIDTVLCCTGENTPVVFADYVSEAINEVYINNELQTGGSYTYTSSGENFVHLDQYRIISTDGCEALGELIIKTKCVNPSFASSSAENPDTVYVDAPVVFNVNTNEPESENYTYSWSTTEVPQSEAILDATVEDATFVGATPGGPYTSTVDIVAQYDGENCPVESISRNYIVIELEDPRYPDAFTPNGDGVNDYYLPIINDLATNTELRIYNRWGDIVYNLADDASKLGWNGQYKNKDQASDLYTYYAKTIHPDGREFIKEGSVSLIR